MPLIETINLTKLYRMGEATVEALREVSVSVEPGEYAAIMGPSGSGKSTFLNILGCLDTPTSGEYLLDNEPVSGLTDGRLSEIRRDKIGFVFQSFNLINELSVLENIEVPLFYRGVGEHDSRQRAGHLAEMVGIGHRLGHRPAELSGGEQQRVAIARALTNDPIIILADEPTGSLDSKTGEEILAILDRLNEQGKTLIVVTHAGEIAARAHRIITFKDGRVHEDGRGGALR
ncbi:MAG: ABC transporter ATP-binding protein [Candidatus Abyssubacteria bacterium]